MQGLFKILSGLTVALFQYDILLCSETLVSEMGHMSELLVPGFSRLSCAGIWIWSISPTQI